MGNAIDEIFEDGKMEGREEGRRGKKDHYPEYVAEGNGQGVYLQGNGMLPAGSCICGRRIMKF